MRETVHTVTIDVRVFDAAQLWTRAMDHAVTKDKMSAVEARELLEPDGVIDVGACLIMLLDPGHLTGCEILQSSSESFNVNTGELI